MASTLVDRVKIYANSSGTGSFVLGGAVPAFRGVEALTDGFTYSYAVELGSDYEIGTGVYVASLGQLTRVPTSSSRGGAPVAFQANAQIAFVALAADLDAAGGDLALRGQLASTSGATMVATDDGTTVQTALDSKASAAALAATNLAVADKASTASVDLKSNATALGVAGSAEDMGGFSSPLLPSGVSAKEVFGGLTENLAASGGASFVGVSDGRTLQATLNMFNQPSTGGFWNGWTAEGLGPPPANLNGRVQRMNDRLFVGAATVTSGDFPATTKDYYETLEAEHTHPYGFRTSWAQFASGSTVGGIGVLGFARTSDTAVDIPFQLGVGGWFASINDNLENPCLATGLYAVAFRMPGAGQGLVGVGTVGGEVDVCNLGSLVQLSPGNLYPPDGFTTGWQVNSGAFSDEANTASAAITIGNNKADWFTGICFGANALAGVNFTGPLAVSGAGSAMRMNTFQQLEWWTNPYNTSCFTIVSRQLTEANFQSIVVSDVGMEFGGPAGAGLAFETHFPGGVTGARLMAVPANGVNPATLTVNGETNAHLRLRPAGTGLISFGVHTAGALAPSGYINIVDDGGTVRRLLVG